MPLYPGASTTVPAANSSTAAIAGTSGNYARSDHAHPTSNVTAGDANFLAWNYDIAMGSASYILSASGTITAIKVNVPTAITVTNINVYLSVIGATLTAGQSFVALYGTSKNLLSASADQAATFAGTTGLKTIALGTPQAISAGTYYVAIWSNGSTMPSFRSAFNSVSANTGLSAANSRWATADTGITTTGPSTLGSFTAIAGTPWVAFS